MRRMDSDYTRLKYSVASIRSLKPNVNKQKLNTLFHEKNGVKCLKPNKWIPLHRHSDPKNILRTKITDIPIGLSISSFI